MPDNPTRQNSINTTFAVTVPFERSVGLGGSAGTGGCGADDTGRGLGAVGGLQREGPGDTEAGDS